MDEIQIPADFSTVTDDQLSELEGQARAAAGPLVEQVNAGDEPLSTTELTALEKLSGVVASVRGERERRIAEASVQSANSSRASDLAATFAAGKQSTEVSATETTPEADPASDENTSEGENDVAVSRPRVAEVAANGTAPAANVQASAKRSGARMIAAPNLPTINAGQEFTTLAEVAVAAEAQMATYQGMGPNVYVKHPVMQLRRNKAAEFTILPSDGVEQTQAKIDAAADEKRLEGGSLVAAAGWCAPSEIDYALFELETNDGMVDIPEVQISRGGIQFTAGPDFSTIFASTGYFHQTEAQVIAATAKPCMVIPCPTFTDKRLEVEGVCITGAFLQDRGYPEMVQRFVRGALTAHAHKLNLFKINQMVTGSTTVDLDPAVVGSVLEDDATALSRLLAILEMGIMDYRYKHRMSQTATLEVVLPYWVLAQLRADAQRRSGTSAEQAFGVTNAQINQWMSMRGARVQWVYDWQDAYNGAGTVGGATPILLFPTAVGFLIYAAGTWVAGVSDVVRLDTVYDSTNLALNQYTQLFTEEGILVAKRGFESRHYQTVLCPTGLTSGTATFACP